MLITVSSQHERKDIVRSLMTAAEPVSRGLASYLKSTTLINPVQLLTFISFCLHGASKATFRLGLIAPTKWPQAVFSQRYRDKLHRVSRLSICWLMDRFNNSVENSAEHQTTNETLFFFRTLSTSALSSKGCDDKRNSVRLERKASHLKS